MSVTIEEFFSSRETEDLNVPPGYLWPSPAICGRDTGHISDAVTMATYRETTFQSSLKSCQNEREKTYLYVFCRSGGNKRVKKNKS